MRDERFWQLKESAKWSLSLDEKRHAIEQLVNIYGRDALQTIEEIKDVTAYEEIRNACIEAIKSAKSTAPTTAGGSEKTAATDPDKKNPDNNNSDAKTKAKNASMKKRSSKKGKNKNHRHHS